MVEALKTLRKREWAMMSICAVFIVLQVWLDLKLPDYMADITKLVETDGSKLHDVLVAGGKMLGVSAASMVCAIVSSLMAAITSSWIAKTLRDRQFKKVQSFGPEEIDRFSTPSLVTRATNDVTQIQMFFTMGLVLVVRAPVMAVWAICKIAGKGIEWTEATGAALGCLLLMIAVLLVTCLPKFKAMQRLTDDVNSVAREGLTGLKTIRAYNAEDYQQSRFEEANSALTRTQLFTARMTAGIMPFMTLVMNGLMLTIYWIGGWLLTRPGDVQWSASSCTKPSVSKGTAAAMAAQGIDPSSMDPSKLIDPAQAQAYADCLKTGVKGAMESRVDVFSNMVVFSSYAIQVIMAFLLCSMLLVLWPRAHASMQRVQEVLDTEPAVQSGAVSTAVDGLAGDVEFRGVSYVYPGKTASSVSNLSFHVKKGQTLAIIGTTGSGKSTIASMIPRLRDASSGEILVDGVPVREWSTTELRKRVGYVTQKAIMMKGTVRSNVCMGLTDGTANDDAATWKALDVAQATEFVSQMDGGLDAEVTQGGSNLSGGQKQRLNIARAVRRRPEIIILDDSTSALDMATDASLRKALATELKGTTVVMIAQRVSTVMAADEIIMLDDGEVIGQGTHRELIKSCPAYREIAETQLGKEALEDGDK